MSNSWCIQIELTNYCWKKCLYCSRYDRHLRRDQRFHLLFHQFKEAFYSLLGYLNENPKAIIGIIGGEPTLHPEFETICQFLKHSIRRERIRLWSTGGPRYRRFEKLIEETFSPMSRYSFNPHDDRQKTACKHQPITMAVRDVVPDETLQWELINNCPFQRRWCPTINHKGAFFCEVAGALDVLLDGPGGWKVEPGWWRRSPAEYVYQQDRLCRWCGMCVPMERELIGKHRQKVSAGLYRKMAELALKGLETCDLVDIRLTREDIERNRKGWDPINYRGDIREDRAG
jgi:organic radical activating enzyme